MTRAVVYIIHHNEDPATTEEAMKTAKRALESKKYPDFLRVGGMQCIDLGVIDDSHPSNKVGMDLEEYFE